MDKVWSLGTLEAAWKSASVGSRDDGTGQGHRHADHRRWPNASFAAHGLFTM